MDGANITAIVSVVGGIVGVVTLSVAWSQMRIASAKTKLDLYNKRFSVYVAALEYYQCVWSKNYEGLGEKANKLTLAFRESKFLFDENDGIYETLGSIQKAGGVIKAWVDNRHESILKGQMLTELQNKSMDAREAMEKDILKLEDRLKSYLSFHNVRGWTVF